MPATQELVIELQSAPAGSTEPERSQEPRPETGQGFAADQERSQEPLTADEISLTAYGLYVAGGYQDGHDLEHWLEAERLLRSRRHG
jgi:hypothetical protein